MTSPSLQLVHVISANDSSKIRTLVEEGEVNVNDKGFLNLPPLLRAALYGKLGALKTFLEFGADKNIRDSQGRTALENWLEKIQLPPDRGNSPAAGVILHVSFT